MNFFEVIKVMAKYFLRVSLIVASVLSVSHINPTVFAEYGSVIVDVKVSGSVPPIPEFACVADLRDNPYDATRADRCLRTILASGCFDSGRIEVKKVGKDHLVRFVLRAPTLRLVEVDYGLPPSQAEAIGRLMERNNALLRPGQAYDLSRDNATRSALEFLVKSHGKRLGISRKVFSNYRTKETRLLYQIWEGPEGPEEPLPPPYEGKCNVYVGPVILTDLNDSTPVTLVESLLRVRSFGCFSIPLLEESKQALLRTGLFEQVEYSVDKEKVHRGVSLHLRTKPTLVEAVSVVGFGTLSNDLAVRSEGLPLQAGEPYLRSKALLTQDYLTKRFSTAGRKIEVFEDAKLLPDARLQITFSVLVFPEDEIIISGASGNKNQ